MYVFKILYATLRQGFHKTMEKSTNKPADGTVFHGLMGAFHQ